MGDKRYMNIPAFVVLARKIPHPLSVTLQSQLRNVLLITINTTMADPLTLVSASVLQKITESAIQAASDKAKPVAKGLLARGSC